MDTTKPDDATVRVANARTAVVVRHLLGSAQKAQTYHVAVLGTGPMAPAVLHVLLTDALCTGIRVCDSSRERLDALKARSTPDDRLRYVLADLATAPCVAIAVQGCRVVVAADLPKEATLAALAEAAGVPGVVAVVAVAPCSPDEVHALRADLAGRPRGAGGAFVVLGCGASPGLTEIQARWAAERLSRVHELRVHCGTITQAPSGPLRHKTLVGTAAVPVNGIPALAVEDGKVVSAVRYEGLETEEFPGAGRVEAWNEYFVPWLLTNVPALRSLPRGSRKTYRWPGFADRAKVLVRLGLASDTPIPGGAQGNPRQVVQQIAESVGNKLPLSTDDQELLTSLGLWEEVGDVKQLLKKAGVIATPKNVLEVLVRRSGACKLAKGEQDMTLMRVTLEGEARDGTGKRITCTLLDRASKGFSSVTRTSGFTAASLARLAAIGEISTAPFEVVHPEQLVFGEKRDLLLRHLENFGVRFEYEEASLPAH